MGRHRPAHRSLSRKRPFVAGAGAGVIALGSLVTGYAGMIRPSSAYATGLVRPAATSGCTGADIEVTNEAQLRAALAGSVDDSVICITESMPVTSPLVIDDTSLTLIGRDDSGVFLNGGGTTGILEADFTGGSHSLAISRLGFINGLRNADDSGAGLQVVGDGDDTLTITDSVFADNAVTGYTNAGGGGVYAGGMATIRVSDTFFVRNRDESAAGSRTDPPGGGGIAMVNSDYASLTRVTTSLNYSRMQGGAIAADEVRRLYVDQLSGTDDSAGGSFGEGGTLWADSFLSTDDTIEITNATVTGAYAETGAAISVQNFNAYALLADSSFTGNESEGGGAVYMEVYGRAVVRDTTFTANTHSGGLGSVGPVGLWMTDSSQTGKGDFTLDNVTITNHSAAAVSGTTALYAKSGPIEILDSTISGNTLNNAAVRLKNYNNANSDGRLVIADTVFHNNTSANFAAGVYIRSYGETGGPANPADVTIRDSVFTANSASNARGGAVLARLWKSGSGVQPRLVVDSSTFGSLDDSSLGNEARDTSIDGTGAAISTKRSGEVLITDSTFGYNTAYSSSSGGGKGGAVYVGFDTDLLTIEGSTFFANSASGNGGALYTFQGEARITNSTFVGNTAVNGAAMSLKKFSVGEGDATLQFVTVADNAATGNGGGVYFRQEGTADDTMAIINSAFTGNTAGTAGADSYTKYFVAPTSTTTVGSSAFATAGGVVGPTVTDGVDGNIVGEALGLGALADNGGPTRTLLPAAGSPLIGAGVPIAGVTTDQRGVARTVPMTIGAVQIFVPGPPPVPPVPAGAPRDVVGVPGDRSAVVSWLPPLNSGSFAVTTYEVVMGDGAQACLVPASTDDTQSCVVEDLVNDDSYVFRVRGLTGAGWGSFSAASEPVVPRALTILVTGSRSGREVRVEGVAPELVGVEVTPWLRFPGPHRYLAGDGVRTVDQQGEFTWQRVTGKKTYVYFRASDGVRSNRVIIPAK